MLFRGDFGAIMHIDIHPPIYVTRTELCNICHSSGEKWASVSILAMRERESVRLYYGRHLVRLVALSLVRLSDGERTPCCGVPDERWEG
jgi:hypothetical protein